MITASPDSTPAATSPVDLTVADLIQAFLLNRHSRPKIAGDRMTPVPVKVRLATGEVVAASGFELTGKGLVIVAGVAKVKGTV